MVKKQLLHVVTTMNASFRAFGLCVVLLLASANRSSAQSNWVWQNPLPQGNPLYGVSMLDAHTVIAVGEAGTVAKSTDAGATWTVHSNVGGLATHFASVSFANVNTGMAVGWTCDYYT